MEMTEFDLEKGFPIPLFIFDLDGTLANIDHRKHFIKVPPCPYCKGDKGYYGGGMNERWMACKECFETGKSTVFEANWEAFYNACNKDKPIESVILILKMLERLGSDIWIFTWREETVGDKTIDWLICEDINFHFMKMRPKNNHMSDVLLKKQWYSDMSTADKKRLVGVFEDRDSVVKMWRELGVQCYQVAEGDF